MAEGTWHKICRVVQRKREFEPELVDRNNLKRCLNCWDLTALGVGSTLGIGVYVLVGAVALKIAGPSILLSFLIAALTSLFAALCYAELGARVPLAGSAFIYTYVTIGEMVGFMVGWNNILEFIFGSASVARGLSSYIDAVTDHAISKWFLEAMPISGSYLSPYFDLFSFLFVLAMGVLLAFGVRESAAVNNVLASLNLLVIVFIIIAGAVKADSSNWSIPADQVPPGYGSGGFFPYGVWGTLKGAAVCFYGFVGFDVVNSSGEEVKEPRRTIPIAILSILSIVFTVYAGISIVTTMMVPYYNLTAVAAVSSAFRAVGWEWARWVVTVSAVLGISTSLFGALFPLPRLLYSMASDGLFLHWFSRVSKRNQSPLIATVVPTVVIALLAALLELEQLILMMCIGTLASYTIVATCVVILRYRSYSVPEVKSGYVKQMMGRGDKEATRTSSVVINFAMCLYICLCIAIAVVCLHTSKPLIPGIILHILAIVVVLVMALQPATDDKIAFKTPLVPFIPCLSIYANVHLMVVINYHTWIRIGIWLLLGIPIYFICIFCYKQKAGRSKSDSYNKPYSDRNVNGKAPAVQIVVVSPTPPDTLARTAADPEEHHEHVQKIHNELQDKAVGANKVEEVIVQNVQIENNAEKEAKIIDLLDQVLQAEEDTYGEVISLKEIKEDDKDTTANEGTIPHRKSLSELSDAGSDASNNQVLSKYDVVAQVHREDLPRVSEEEEKVEGNEEFPNYDDEEITAFNESDETNSRTDESGYSDTIDRPALSELVEDSDVPIIPPPPPLDENYFKTSAAPLNFKKFNTVIPRYPQLDVDDEEVDEPRVSITSNNSQGDANMRFGSDRQIKFMSKLNNIFQKSIVPNEEEEPRQRSLSTGNVLANTELSAIRDRPSMFLELKKELLSRDAAQILRPINTEEKPPEPEPITVPEKVEVKVEEDEEDKSLSREDLKNKLENIFAVGGPQLLKPRLMKSNANTPEEAAQSDQSSTESIPKLPKMDRNDTLKRQKDNFSKVLNSFRLSMNKDDANV
ncbi:unnamed protein product [Chrysodeixis includens]|uniref:Cationic amino acid transporter C-terminal domain-containing protein n=1 Tax=Chrysodeixis includens TaxID=689277 RepID=A0A9P0FTF2_CHRIL|nr:unnamed protein product [Chrysodeixis includens]